MSVVPGRGGRMRRVVAAGCAFALVSCAGAPPAPRAAQFPFPVDSVRSRVLADGVGLHAVYASTGRWVIQVLDVRLDRCYSAVALKGGTSAIGRTRTTELLRSASGVAAVNADFFLFTPPGVPTNAHVSRGRLLTPPNRRPLFVVDSAGRPSIGTFTLPGLDSLAVDDARLAAASLRPFHPMEAVGGRPVLARDSVITPDVDTEGGASFATARHPRTAVGIADGGRRLFLAVVDGRQAGYSDGMTLRETAVLMLALGASQAVNLDGGGSSTLAYVDPDSAGVIRIANRPSDPTGERPVGNALAIVRGCRR